MSEEGNIDLSARIYSQPHVPVFLLAGRPCVEKHALNLRDRPWITMIPIDGDLAGALTKLRQQHGIGRLSCVGGRTLATALVDAGFVQDLYLTTSPIEAGEPNTPWYAGDRPPRLDVIARKHEDAPEHPIVFEHLAVSRQRDRSCLLSDRARADRPERREWSMRTVRNVLAVFLSVSLALPVGARAQHPSVVDQAMLDRVLATRVMHADADRLAIRALLEREQVREIAAGAGIDITRASAAVATLDGAELQQLAGQARAVDEALAGGQGTVTLKTTTIIIGLLVLILLILVLK
jgi:hypothetical protein